MEGKGRGKLLLVEDENLLLCLIAEFLRTEGFEVIEAADGLEGAGVFTGQGPFDLVLLDLNLPLLSGVDVCRQIKTRHPLQPVLICSAAILDCHVAALHALNVDQFLTKPYHPLDLLDRITFELARTISSGGEPNHRPQPTASGSPKTLSRSVRQSSNPGQASSVGLR